MNTIINTGVVTTHGIQRAKERQNLKNIRSVEKTVQLAIQRGRRAEDCTSWERNYLSKECRNGCTAVAYNNFCYIINDTGICVTIYPLPAWFDKKKAFNGKERIRNFKRYYRHNADFYMQGIVC